VFIVVCWPRSAQDNPAPPWSSFTRWRPLAVLVVGMLLAAGVAAFQILETRQAQRLSVRRRLSYEQFSDGAFRFSMAWKSWLDPFHIMGDVTAYVSPLVTLLAVISVVVALWQRPRERRIFFWLAVAVAAWFLMCGPHSPIYPLVYKIPFINLFRVPSRHTFEWTLAASVMAAYGWDWAANWVRRHANRFSSRPALTWANAIFWVAASLAAGVAWYRASKALLPVNPPNLEILSYPYLQWKLALLLLTMLAVVSVWLIGQRSLRGALLAFTVAIVCFFEPFNFVSYHAPPYSTPVSRLKYLAPSTKLAQQAPAEQNRVYSQLAMDFDGPAADLPNITALAGLHNVAGFEPLMMERYSRALNSSAWDTVNRGPNLVYDRSLFEPQSHVLDLLNTTFVISYNNFGYSAGSLIEKEGITFDNSFNIADLSASSPTVLSANGAEADTLAVVTTMGRSNHIADETPVARMTIHTTDGQVVERLLRAGSDTSEWAHERPDVKATSRHRLATVFDSHPGDEQNSFPSLRYWSRINLGGKLRVKRVELIKLVMDADVGFWHMSLFDTETRTSAQLRPFDPDRWEPVIDKDGVMVARNKRALPRAWLVTEAEALDGTEIWRRIRGLPPPKGITDKPFDPRRTALIEIEPGKLPKLSGRPLSSDSYARIVNYEPSRLVIETNSDQEALMVLSEIHYPGWVAMLDGVKTPVHQTNFLLRGVVVPAGKHQIEMSYRAPQARNGAIISLLTLGIIGWIAFRARRTHSSQVSLVSEKPRRL
jgi:hypothetical protein